jgi:hypothetical protein
MGTIAGKPVIKGFLLTCAPIHWLLATEMTVTPDYDDNVFPGITL